MSNSMDRFDRVEELFLAAIEMSEQDREQYLLSECGDDARLLQEVQSLLREDARENDPLEAGLAEVSVSGGSDADYLQKLLDEHRHDTLPGTALSPDEFLRLLSKIEILSDEEMGSWSDHQSDQVKSNARLLADELVKDGKLTHYQASILLKGQAEPLLVDKYLILDAIDSGGMGIVFKAVHRPMNRVVALKMLPEKLLNSSDKVNRFRREVRVAASLQHPNVVMAHDADESKGVHFLVMEYVSGQDLRKLVRDQGPLPVPEAVDILNQAAEALKYAHRKNVIHRDIKPRNIMLSKEGDVKVLDMGLARIEAGGLLSEDSGETKVADSLTYGDPMTENPNLTQAGAVMGTIAFMAPEQAIDAKNSDARTDIYSLGCTFYFLLTGEPPFKGATSLKTILAHREEDIPSLRQVREDVPEALVQLFEKMLQKKSDDRFQSAGELLDAIDDCGISLPPEIKQRQRPQRTQPLPGTIAEQTVQLGRRRENVPSETARWRSRRGWIVTAVLVFSLAMLFMLNRDWFFPKPDTSTVGNMETPVEVELATQPAVTERPQENYALQFDGVDDYVELMGLTDENFASVTLEGWLTPKSLVSGEPVWIGNTNNAGLALFLFNGYWAICYHSVQGDSQYEYLVSDTLAKLDQNSHVAGVFDILNKELRLFIDGELVASMPLREGPHLTSQWSIHLAAEPEGADEQSNFIKGEIDEVRISNIARYTEDFTPMDRFETDEHTLALYHFDEGQGDVLKDSSGNGHHGQIHGATWVKVKDQNKSLTDNSPDLLVGLSASDVIKQKATPQCGDWNFNGSEISYRIEPPAVINGSMSELRLRRKCPKDYQLEMEFTSHAEAPERLGIMLPFGKKAVYLALQSYGNGSGLIRVDGLEFSPQNKSANIDWTPVVHGEKQKLVVSVVTTGDDISIEARIDGKRFSQYSGAQDRLSNLSWKPAEGLVLRTDQPLTIHSAKLTPLSAADLLATGEWEWREIETFNSPVGSKDKKVLQADMSDDGLTLIFSMDAEGKDSPRGEGRTDLYMVNRDTIDQPWGKPVNLGPTINTLAMDHHPVLSSDGLELFFSRRESWEPAHAPIYYCTRKSRGSLWSKAMPIDVESRGTPSVTPDGLMMFICYNWDIHLCTRDSPDSEWSEPIRLDALSKANESEFDVTCSDDGRLLIFQRAEQLWMSLRVGDNLLEWTPPIPLTSLLPIDRIKNEGNKTPRLIGDGRTLLFVRRRENVPEISIARLVRKDSPVEPIKGLPLEEQPLTAPKPTAADLLATDEWELVDIEQLPFAVSSGGDSTDDRCAIVYSNYPRLWTSTRSAVGEPWAVPQPLDGNEQAKTVHPSLSPNGLRMAFTELSPEDGARTFVLRRDSVSAPWTDKESSAIQDYYAPDLYEDQKFAAVVEHHKIYVLEKTGEAEWSRRLFEREHRTANGHDSVTISSDGQRLAFVAGLSDITGDSNFGIYISTRVDSESEWSQPSLIKCEDVKRMSHPRLFSRGQWLAFKGDRNMFLARLVLRDAPEEPMRVPQEQLLAKDNPSAADLLATGNYEWRVVERLPETINSPQSEKGGDMTADGLICVFSSYRQEGGYGNNDLWMATRSSIDDDWSDAVNLGDVINSSGTEWCPALSPDGLRLVFKKGEKDIVISERESIAAPWSAPVLYDIQALVPPDPGIHADAYVITRWHRTQDGAGGPDLFFTKRSNSNAPWPNPTRLPDNINTAEEETASSVSDDGRLIIFNRRNKVTGKGEAWMTTRGGWNDRWADPVQLDFLGDDYGVGSPRLLPDGKTIIFSARENNSPFDLFLARLVRKDAPVEPIKGLPLGEQPKTVTEPSAADLLATGEYEWSEPENLGAPINSTYSEVSGDISPNGLTIVFGSSRPGGLGSNDLWQSARQTTDSPWSEPQHLGKAINSDQNDLHPCFSSDGLRLTFERSGQGKRIRTYIISRPTVNAQWSNPRLVEDVGNAVKVSSDGLKRVFSKPVRAIEPGVGNIDLFFQTRSIDGDTWSSAGRFGAAINSKIQEYNGSMTSDFRFLVFQRGEQTLLTTWRDTSSHEWRAPTPFPSDRTKSKAAILLDDNSSILFSSARPDGLGGDDLYLSRLVRKDTSVEPIKGLEEDVTTDSRPTQPTDQQPQIPSAPPLPSDED